MYTQCKVTFFPYNNERNPSFFSYNYEICDNIFDLYYFL